MTIKNWIKSTNQGFTLVELMVVVAIIGLLSAVAVPNFKKYQAKAKASEAKLQLSAIYMSEQSFSMDYNAYATCLNIMGYDPSKEYQSRYYSVGFSATNAAANTFAVTNSQAPNGCSTAGITIVPPVVTTAASNSTSIYAYGSGKMVNNVRSVVADLATFAPAPSAPVVGAAPYSTFIAGAVGVISGDFQLNTNSDYWQINQNKLITQWRPGY